MIEVQRKDYLLLLSFNPCELFSYFGVRELHGASIKECSMYRNTKNDAYIAGFSNYIPYSDNDDDYEHGDDFFVFINLSRCTNNKETLLLLNHEIMHRAFERYNWNVAGKEEEMVSWAEKETAEVYNIVKQYL